MSVTTPHPAQATSAATTNARSVVRTRRRTPGASLGALPVANLVLIEVGAAIGLVLALIDNKLLPVSGGIALVALILALLRRRGRWFTQWFALTLQYATRSHRRVAEPPEAPEADANSEQGSTSEKTEQSAEPVVGPDDPRVSLLRLAVPDLVVAHGQDHERNPVGFAWHEGTWTAVLMVEPPPSLINDLDSTPNLPLGVLAPCLEDRGVVLDSIQVIWHCYPGSAALPSDSPALNSYLELLGPLPAAARRTTWVAVRLDPRHCPEAVSERGGGVIGAHRALIGALARVRSALGARGVPTRPLDSDELLRAGIVSAELQSVVGAQRAVGLKERWSNVTAGGVGHSSYAITKWPSEMDHTLNVFTGVRALSSTVTMSLAPSGDDGEVGLRGLVRVSARTPEELDQADDRLKDLSHQLGIGLTPLRGLQTSGLAATLPLGGVA